jgi:hypothetical protein
MKLGLPPKLMVSSEFHPSLNANVLLCRVFLNLTLCMTTKLRVLVLCFSFFTDNSITWIVVSFVSFCFGLEC